MAQLVESAPGPLASIYPDEIAGGATAAPQMNAVFQQATLATGVNRDGLLAPDDAFTMSAHIRASPAMCARFVEGHGDDEG